jgi:S1-C subfamily serine protease
LTVVVERASSPRPSKTAKARPPATGSDEGLHIVLSVDGHPAALVLDGWHRTTSGLELIDGRGADQNGTAFHGEILARYRTVTVVCTVGPGSVDATADGRTIVHWTGRSDRLSIEPGLAADIGHGLGLISSSQFRIRRIELAPLSGTALPVGPPAVAASTGPAAGPAAQAPPPPAGLPAAPGPAAPASQVAVAAATPAPALAPARAKPARPTAVPSPQALQCVALIEHPLGSGSGFAIGKKLVVTNAHVVEAVFADEIKVRFGTENSKPQPVARILYFDRPRDLCVLELKQSELAGLPVRGDYAFNSGDRVTLVGNPTAGGGILMRNAVNHGRFSGVVRIKEQDFYQIDASVNPGWSGGPVLDDEGRVVAIVAMKAADKAVTELRGAMGKLDQEFRTRIGRTGYNIGLTYGIPAGALGNVLKDPDFHDEDRQAEANDRCAARALADRLSFLAVLSMLRVQINVPAKVRLEAASLAHGKTLAGSHRRPAPGEVLTFMPHPEAARLGRVLDSDSLKSLESKFQDRLDERIDAIQASAYLGDVVKRDLRTLAAKVREANKFAEHPPATYAAFSVKVKGFSHDFKEHLKRLAEYLKEKEEERE